jgi:hypothetical protein
MSNRDQDRKLAPHQKWIWREAFKASMQHMSIEAAEKKAWIVVDMWEKVGAFNESISSTIELTKPTVDLKPAWYFLIDALNQSADNITDLEQRLSRTMLDYINNDSSYEEFTAIIPLILKEST